MCSRATIVNFACDLRTFLVAIAAIVDLLKDRAPPAQSPLAALSLRSMTDNRWSLYPQPLIRQSILHASRKTEREISMKNPDLRTVIVLVSIMTFSTLSCVSAQSPAGKAPDAPASDDAAAQQDESAPKVADESKGAKESKETKQANKVAEEKADPQIALLKAENERLRLANDVAQQQQVEALQKVQSQRATLDAELALLNAKDSTASASDRARIESLQRAQKLREAELSAELASLAIESQKLKQMSDLSSAQLQAELWKGKAELERARMSEDLLDMKVRSTTAALRREQELLAAQNSLAAEKRRADQSKVADDQLRATSAALTLGFQIQTRDLSDKWRNAVNTPAEYAVEPFQNGILTISDRKIELNGPIMSGSADFVCDRIDFFNNQDRTKPIFVVIDNSPGGSVMQGYRILKAVQTSDAPVHVVVKSFAASMAATIATLAPHSYAYPNAIILHHQMSGAAIGNMTNMEEEVKTMREWERRLAEPIAKKMGISLDEFKARMYSAKKSGDWDEFADKAVQLKWIDHLVNEIREEGIRTKPSGGRSGSMWMTMLQHDEQGKPYFLLPPLDPYDCYFMVNPRGFYRVDGR